MSEFTFDAPLFQESGTWVFAALPFDVADDVDELTSGRTGGFGSVRVEVTLGPTTWRTSLFPDKGRETFVLPVKRAVRTAAGVQPGDTVRIALRLLDV
ncbi:DUF1905 domain-containing protein [Cellulomonas shaoxiangyii]|uniref:DUF1905 domain-containing protein n=1 Tax=Cellulomonas shaoxiangyii TaxID=2566013 RepID=A0A4P7SFV2_9CELL|nr:DUF1905 domain-containing protein [Cellulomonas shaoxiangyii]QCB92448.1 DUF1905 domain-containing protein [Cellulomonas shaoxiangyii]TGY85651.1 DUF1905 domain-containing protein [Cellulomonas shaoxiangyii]